MALQPKQRLGPYEVLAAVGAGGMGEVYRAHDGRLNRDVALKVLPEAFAADPDRMARFEREARVLGALNHPNIASIYGLEEFGSGRALVMELVEGPTLADRIARGPIPLDEALPIANQVAEALEYAHDRGVIHRDLKPANVKVTADGTVKVLDFGLAKALMDEPVAADPRDSPTLSMAPTMTGVILGTAAYMSPEQAKGKPVDRRADIWAFGVVLLEMLTGKPVYSGDTAAETLAFVMTKDPPLDALPKNTPPAIRNLLRRCLERKMRQRLQHIGEARIVLENVPFEATTTAEPPATRRPSLLSNAKVAWSITIVICFAVLALGAFAFFQNKPEEKQSFRFFVSPPDNWSLAQRGGTTAGVAAPLAISPDGHRIAFVATDVKHKPLLWVRSLDSLAPQALAGTGDASSPFWAPDSRFLGFYAGGKLKKIDVSGGPAITLCDAPVSAGATWNQDGVIVFAPTNHSALQRVSAAGGVPTAATVLGEGEIAHWRPSFLPDGQHFVYRAIKGTSAGPLPIYLSSLGSPERKLLLNTESNNVLYSQGYLLFLRERTLMAQPFDSRHLLLTGDPFPVAEQIQIQGSPVPYGLFAASASGVLAYQTGTGNGSQLQLVWFDRSGKQIGTLGDLALYEDLELSPDGKHTSISIPDQAGNGRNIWVYDVARGVRTRFTFDAAEERSSLWSPDNNQVVFNSNRKGHYDLYQKASNGTGPEAALLEDHFEKRPESWSPDGRFILYTSLDTSSSDGNGAHDELFVLPLSGDRKPFPFLKTQFNEAAGRFSPDGRWVAYMSDESGRYEIYVAAFPGPGGKWRVSTTGGSWPQWRHDGAEIFYVAPDNNMMAAAVNGKGSNFEVGAVKALFEAPVSLGRSPYVVSSDGQRFLINVAPQPAAASTPITVVVNWAEGLKK